MIYADLSNFFFPTERGKRTRERRRRRRRANVINIDQNIF